MKLKKLREICYRAGTINRWPTIRMRREQSIAEHSHLTTVIAMAIMDVLEIKEPRIMKNVLESALMHDMDEIYTGDIPAPVKEIVKSAMVNATLEQRRMIDDNPVEDFFVPEKPADTEVAIIVGLADIVEAQLFLKAESDDPRKGFILEELAKFTDVFFDKLKKYRPDEFVCSLESKIRGLLLNYPEKI
jgi:5'-deoxynucleotidase YfbR-like HD superfamily hydrolase